MATQPNVEYESSRFGERDHSPGPKKGAKAPGFVGKGWFPLKIIVPVAGREEKKDIQKIVITARHRNTHRNTVILVYRRSAKLGGGRVYACGAGDVAGDVRSADGDDGWAGVVAGRWGGGSGGLRRDHG